MERIYADIIFYPRKKIKKICENPPNLCNLCSNQKLLIHNLVLQIYRHLVDGLEDGIHSLGVHS